MISKEKSFNFKIGRIWQVWIPLAFKLDHSLATRENLALLDVNDARAFSWRGKTCTLRESGYCFKVRSLLRLFQRVRHCLIKSYFAWVSIGIKWNLRVQVETAPASLRSKDASFHYILTTPVVFESEYLSFPNQLDLNWDTPNSKIGWENGNLECLGNSRWTICSPGSKFF